MICVGAGRAPTARRGVMLAVTYIQPDSEL
jgi:hypothetical protein